MGKQFKSVPNFAHVEKKLPEFLTSHVTMKRMKKVSMGHLHCQDKKKFLDADDPIVLNAAKRKISSNEPPIHRESVFKVFQNPKLVTTILKKLDLPDLKTCRRVSLTWDDLASHVMQTRRSIQISLVYSESKGVYLKPNSTNENEDCPSSSSAPAPAEMKQKNLSNLIKCMESSRNFPCQNFRFVSGDFESHQVQTFFSLFGPQIRELHLTFGRRHGHGQNEDKKNNWVTPTKFLRHLLSDQAPNIYHLKISLVSQSRGILDNNSIDLVNPPNSSSSLGTIKKLPNLKTLAIGHWFESEVQIVREILSAASKIDEFYHDELVDTFLPVVVETGKIHTVQKVCFSLQNFSKMYLNSFSKFSSVGPQLVQFEIGVQPRDWRVLKMAAGIVNKLLQSSQLTLQTLTLHPLAAISKSYKIHLPALPNLNRLILRTTNSSGLISTLSQAQRMSPTRFKDEAIFPEGNFEPGNFSRVQNVIVDLVTDRDCFWEHHFPEKELKTPIVFSTVKCLEVQRPCTLFWIQKLAIMFPNVVDLKLTIQNGSNSKMTEQVLEAWPQLEFLAFRDLTASPDITKL